MIQRAFGFETGDVYVEDRISMNCILERIQDPHAEWNNLGIWVNAQNFNGVLTIRDGKVVLMPYEDIINDPTVIKAGVRKLNSKFRNEERSMIKDYYRRIYSTAELRSSINVVSRVFQRMALSDHPKVKSPEYFPGPNGDLRDKYGNALKPYRAGKTQKDLTIFGLVSSIISQARVFGLTYNPEINLSDFNLGEFMDLYLQDVHELKQEPFRNGSQSKNLTKEMKALLMSRGGREGGEILNLYYENHFFMLEEGVENEEIFEMEDVNIAVKSTRKDPAKASEKAKLMQSEENLRRAIRERKIQERLQPSGISYK